MADPPRRPRPNAPGTRVPLPSPVPPPDSLPPPASEETDDRVLWQTEARDRRRPAPVARRRSETPVVVSEPPPPMSWRHKGVMLPHWAMGLIGVITALGGTAGVKSIIDSFAPKPATTAQADDLRERMARLESKLDELAAQQQRDRRREATRWDIAQGALCRLNGSKPAPFARGVDCDALTWDPPPLGALGPWVAREEWPNTEKLR